MKAKFKVTMDVIIDYKVLEQNPAVVLERALLTAESKVTPFEIRNIVYTQILVSQDEHRTTSPA